TLPTYLRAGTLDVFCLRPQPLLLQLITSDVSLRRLARAAVGAVALTAGLLLNDIAWSPSHVLLLVLTVVSGYAVFAGMFEWAGWCAPLAPVWTWTWALVSWRLGVRHYQGGGG